MSLFQRLKNDLNPFDGQKNDSLKNNPVTRGLSRAYDQVNPLDSGRSWQTRTPSREQAKLSSVSQGGRVLAPAAGKTLNTLAAIPGELYGTTRQTAATLTRNQIAARNANNWLKNYHEQAYDPTGGLFGVGTVFKSPEEAMSGRKDIVLKRVGGNTLSSAAEILPTVRGGSFATKGLGIKKVLPRMLTENTSYGLVGSAGNQYVQNGNIDAKQLAKDVAVSNVMGLSTYGLQKGASYGLNKATSAVDTGRDRIAKLLSQQTDNAVEEAPTTPKVVQPQKNYGAPKPKTPEIKIEDNSTTRQLPSGNKVVSWETVSSDGSLRYNTEFKITPDGKKTVTVNNIDENGNITGSSILGDYEKVAKKYGTYDPEEIAKRATISEVTAYDKAGNPIWSEKGNIVSPTKATPIESTTVNNVVPPTESKLGTIAQDFFDSRKGNQKISFQDLEQLFQNPNSPEATAKARENVAKMQNPVDKQIKDYQTTKKQILDAVTQELLAKNNTRNLKSEVLANGGISSTAYETYPKGIIRKAGVSADQMARTLGFDSENTFMDALNSQSTPLKPTEARAQAEQLLSSGKHQYSQDWNLADNLISKRTLELQQLPKGAKEVKPTSTVPSEEDFMSLMGQAEKEAPQSKGALNEVRSNNREQVAAAVKAGDFETAAKLRNDGAKIAMDRRQMAEKGKAAYPPKEQPAVNELQPKSIKDKKVKQEFRAFTNEYLGTKKAAQTSADELIRNINEFVPLNSKQKLEALEVIDGAKTTTDPQVQKYVDAYRRTTDELYKSYTDQGVKMGYQTEYLPRNYKNPTTGEAITRQEYDILARGSGRMQSRTAETLNIDALISKDPNELLKRYIESMDSAVAGRKYFTNLEQKGYIVQSLDGKPVRGMKPVLSEGLGGDGIYYAKPDVADALNKIFGTQPDNGVLGKTLDKTAKVSANIQDIVLSGGVPGRPFNAFTIAQLQKEVTAGHPVRAIKTFVNSWSPKKFDEFARANAQSIREIQQGGIDINAKIADTYQGTIQQILGSDSKFKEAWGQMAYDPTFKRFMPTLEIMKYNATKNSLIKKGVSEAEARATAIESLKNWTGKRDMYANATASKVGSDAATTLLFAPKYRESMINFWKNNAKAFSKENIKNPAFADNRRFVMGALVTLVGMNAANYGLNGTTMAGNPDGKKDKLLVPIGQTEEGNRKYLGIPYMSSIATVPRNVAMGGYNLLTGKFNEAGKNASSFLSIPVRTTTDILNNENYFGSKIYDPNASAPQRVASAAAYVAKNNMHPYVREGLNIAGGKLPEDAQKALGVQKIPLYQSASQATELPLKFYDSQYFKNGDSKINPAGANKSYTGSANILNIGAGIAKNKNGDPYSEVEIQRAAAFSGSKAKEDFYNLTDKEKLAAAKASPEGRAMYDEWQTIGRTFKEDNNLYSPDLTKDLAKQVLGVEVDPIPTMQKYARLSEQQKAAFLEKNKDAEFNLKASQYLRDLTDGKLTEVEKINKESELEKAYIAKDYSKSVRDLYNLSEAKIYNYVSTHKNGNELVNKMVALDDALVAAGVISNNKLRDKYGNISIGAKKKSGRSTGSMPNFNNFGLTSSLAAPKIAAPSVKRATMQRGRFAKKPA